MAFVHRMLIVALFLLIALGEGVRARAVSGRWEFSEFFRKDRSSGSYMARIILVRAKG